LASLKDILDRELGRYGEHLCDLMCVAERLRRTVDERLLQKWRDGQRPTPPVVHVRVKSADSVRRRIEERYARLEEFPDLIGCRIVVLHSSEIKLGDSAVRGLFDLGPPEEFTSLTHRGRATGYSGIVWEKIPLRHLADLPEISQSLANVGGFAWELQIQTEMQEAWTRLSHGHFYKNRIGVPNRTQRLLRRLAAITDMVDDEFARIEAHLGEETRQIEDRLHTRNAHDTVELDEFVLFTIAGIWDGLLETLRRLGREAGCRRSEWQELVRIGDETDLCASVCERTGLRTVGQFRGYLGGLVAKDRQARTRERLATLVRLADAAPPRSPQLPVPAVIDRPLLLFSLLRLVDHPDEIETSRPLRATLKRALRSFVDETGGN
jgi:ppGpp synthetase/RelA/SpoT-type nucleotidyltranferase